MTVAMVAPKLNRLDLWVKQLGQDNPQGAIELLASPIQATTNGTPLPNVISISYGVCEATAKPASAARTLFDREAAAIDALGITTSWRPATVARQPVHTGSSRAGHERQCYRENSDAGTAFHSRQRRSFDDVFRAPLAEGLSHVGEPARI